MCQKCIRYFSFAILSLILMHPARAMEIPSTCLTRTECQDMQNTVEVETNSDGTALTATKVDAIRHCAKKNAHVPSAFEIAQWAESLGSLPTLTLLDVVYQYDGVVPNGYTEIKSINSANQPEKFYYSTRGYKPSQEPLKNGWIWTASYLENPSNDGFFFFGAAGKLISAKNIKNTKALILCFKNS